MMKIRTLAILNAVTLLSHILISYSTKFGFIGDRTVGEIANAYPSLYTPSSMTFGIWGIIYAALAMFCIYHLFCAFRQKEDFPANRDIKDIGVLFILNNLASIAWLIVWTNNQMLNSLVLMGIQLVTLVAINMRLKIHDEHRRFSSKAFTQFPFSIYFAWITVATLSNAGTFLIASGWQGFGLGFSVSEWTIILIIFMIMMTELVIITRRNVSFGLVIIWALYGIILKRQEAGDISSGIMETAWMGTGVVSLTCLVQLIRNFVYENTLNQDVPDYSETEETPAALPATSSRESSI